MRKRHHPSANMERDVIVSVITLYTLICAAMLAMHYLQPKGAETVTSSTSPSHREFSTTGSAIPSEPEDTTNGQ